MSPTVAAHKQTIESELIEKLQQGADDTITIFYVSLPLGILITVMILILLYYSLWK